MKKNSLFGLRGNAYTSIIAIVLVAIFFLYQAVAYSHRPKIEDPRIVLSQYSYENVTQYSFVRSRGNRPDEPIELKEEDFKELFFLLRTSLENNTKSRYLSTRDFQIDIVFSDGSSVSATFLLQNYDDLRVILNGRRFDSPDILKWLSDYFQ